MYTEKSNRWIEFWPSINCESLQLNRFLKLFYFTYLSVMIVYQIQFILTDQTFSIVFVSCFEQNKKNVSSSFSIKILQPLSSADENTFIRFQQTDTEKTSLAKYPALCIEYFQHLYEFVYRKNSELFVALFIFERGKPLSISLVTPNTEYVN